MTELVDSDTRLLQQRQPDVSQRRVPGQLDTFSKTQPLDTAARKKQREIFDGMRGLDVCAVTHDAVIVNALAIEIGLLFQSIQEITEQLCAFLVSKTGVHLRFVGDVVMRQGVNREVMPMLVRTDCDGIM